MLYLTKEQARQLIEHSKKELPNEACGILAGSDNRIEKRYEMTNTDKSSQSFLMDPLQQLEVIKEIRNLKLEMLGIYHSHPQSQAFPSAHDVRLAYYPESSYLIISLKDKDKPSIRSFKIVEGDIKEEKLIIE